MNRGNAIENRPYKCPGCHAELQAGAAAVEHMACCARLQDMIAAGRAKHKARCKKDKDLRTTKFRKHLALNGNYFGQAQVSDFRDCAIVNT